MKYSMEHQSYLEQIIRAKYTILNTCLYVITVFKFKDAFVFLIFCLNTHFLYISYIFCIIQFLYYFCVFKNISSISSYACIEIVHRDTIQSSDIHLLCLQIYFDIYSRQSMQVYNRLELTLKLS